MPLNYVEFTSMNNLPSKLVLQLISTYDAAESLQQDGKWPRTYSCDQEQCPKCGKKLLPLSKRQQKSSSDRQILVSKLHDIVIEILSKKCKSCYLILSPNTLQYGLLNIGDVTLVSFNVFFTLRNTVR